MEDFYKVEGESEPQLVAHLKEQRVRLSVIENKILDKRDGVWPGFAIEAFIQQWEVLTRTPIYGNYLG